MLGWYKRSEAFRLIFTSPNHLAELKVCSTELQGDTKHYRHFTKVPKSRSLIMIRPQLSRQKREASQDLIKPIYDLHHCLDPLSYCHERSWHRLLKSLSSIKSVSFIHFDPEFLFLRDTDRNLGDIKCSGISSTLLKENLSPTN